MAGLANPRKVFRYALEIDGANMFLIQSVTPPKVELAQTDHGSPGNIPNGKTPGKLTVSDMVVKKLKPANLNDAWAWDWLGLAIAGLAKEYNKIGFLTELSPDGVGTLQKFYLGAIWPKIISLSEYNSANSDNLLEEVTFAVQFYYPTNSAIFTQLFGGSAARAGGAAFNIGQGG